MKSSSEDGEVNLRSHAKSVKLKESHAAKNNTMSTDTKVFIQKLCYRKTASIDMTQYGFISDSKVYPVKCIIKPLREQLEKISVKPTSTKHSTTTTSTSRTKPLEVVSSAERKPKTCALKSAMSYPGTHSSRTCLRPLPAIKEKKVRLVSPKKSKSKNVGSKNDVRPRKINFIK